MARSKGGRRGNNYTTNVTLPRRPWPKYNTPLFQQNLNYEIAKSKNWRTYEDRRTFHPLQAAAPALSINQGRSRLTLRDRRQVVSRMYNPQIGFASPVHSVFSQTKAAIGFANPRRVLICLRRGVRRQIMHALGHAGRTGQKPPVKNWYSQISCKG